MAPDILLLGANGQVGWELRRALAPLGRVIPLTRTEVDFSRIDDLIQAVRRTRPAIIVNAAAYTAVDKAESDEGTATRLNAMVPEALADEARRLGALLVDYSTDYVFDGTLDRPYLETDAPAPLGVYGRSKLAGLRAVEASGCRHLVFRVSWVYGVHGANFVKTILRLARERRELRVVADQIGAPTPADLIADVTAHALAALARGRGVEGVYHLAPAGQTSWHGFAKAIVAEAAALGVPLALTASDVHPIATADYPTAARRPANSLLNTAKLRTGFGFHLPEWVEPVPRILREMITQ
ncbi:MAG: dTDP-4-dehydrorhamnose reductase [Thiohalomonadaceae bacterium]